MPPQIRFSRCLVLKQVVLLIVRVTTRLGFKPTLLQAIFVLELGSIKTKAFLT